MTTLPDTSEVFSSHIPALQVLMSMGYVYLPPGEITKQRNGNISDVLLREVLITELRKRHFTWKGKEYSLSNNAIDEIICQLTSPELGKDLLTANEQIYDRLISGITVTEFIDNKKTRPTIHIIDWHNDNNNQFHVTDAFEILNAEGTNVQRPDIVCFINGIPLVVIETRHTDPHNSHKDMIREGIAQHIRNQSTTGIPSLYAFSQLLLSVNGQNGRYGTTRTPSKLWALWRDEELDAPVFDEIKNRVLYKKQKALLFEHRPAWMFDYFNKRHAQGKLLSTGQDHLIISLMRPDRLLAFIQFFILFDKKNGKFVARYQQYFGVRRLVERVCQKNMRGEREGGVLWHTTGSGKSFTMAFATKTLTQHKALKHCRFVVVTDRVDLENRLSYIFTSTETLASTRNTGQTRTRTGKDLAERISNGKERLLFSMTRKFTAAARQLESRNLDQSIIVLIDEGCDNHGGKIYARMRQMLPIAAFVAFTGMPLLRKDKTRNPFGPVIHTYTIQQAMDDNIITPLLYEERIPDPATHKKMINHRPIRITKERTNKQKVNSKSIPAQKVETVYHSDNRIELIAHDISDHFVKNIPHGMKGQLATDNKLSAIRYKKILDNIGRVSSEVVISSPNTHEGGDEINENLRLEIQQWWRLTVGNLHDAAYTQKIMRQFTEKNDPQLLIVVDRFLTNVDEPRNTVLYIDKALKNHNIIQASAGINRRHRLKKFGFLVDYRGILRALDTTLNNPEQENGFDSDDLTGLYRQTNTEYKKLPLLHKQMWALFKNVKNRKNPKNLREILLPHYKEDTGVFFDAHQYIRENFYNAVKNFSDCLEIALGSANVYENNFFTKEDIKTFQHDLIFFTNLQCIVQRDANEKMNLYHSTAYIKKISKTSYLATKNIQESASIYFDNKPVEKNISKTWAAERIKHEINIIRIHIKKSISQELRNDPYAQKVFSALLEKNDREAEKNPPLFYKHYKSFINLKTQVQNKIVPGIPKALIDQPHARAYYGVFHIVLNDGATNTISDNEKQAYISHALMINKTVNKAIAEYSLNPKNLENEIRGKLLPSIFKQTGIKKAKEIIEQIIQIIPSEPTKQSNTC